MTSMEFAAGGAEPANAEDCFGLGMIFSAGAGVAVDLVQAHKWFNIAAMRGHADAARLRREIAEQMSRCRDRLRAARGARLAQGSSAGAGCRCRRSASRPDRSDYSGRRCATARRASPQSRLASRRARADGTAAPAGTRGCACR